MKNFSEMTGITFKVLSDSFVMKMVKKKIEANTNVVFALSFFLPNQFNLNKPIPYSNASEGKVFTSKLKSQRLNKH